MLVISTSWWSHFNNLTLLLRTRSYRVSAWSKVVDRVAGDTGQYSLYLDSTVSTIVIKQYNFYRPQSGEIMHLVASVRLYVRAILFEPFDLGFAECSKEQRRVIISPRCLSVCQLIARMRSIGFCMIKT